MVGWSVRGREEVAWVGPGRVPGGCGGRIGEDPVPGRESTRAGQGALIGRTVRRGKVPTRVKHPCLDWPATSLLLRRFAFTRWSSSYSSSGSLIR